MIKSGNQFIEFLNNKDKKRETGLIVFLKGKVDGKPVTDLKRAQEWCFDKEQNWNYCYTARYQADGKGAIITPLIRQFIKDVGATSDFSKKVSEETIGDIQKAKNTDWTSFEEAILRLDSTDEIMDNELIKNFSSVVGSFIDQGKRLVLFCELNTEAKSDVDKIGLDTGSVQKILQLLSERFILVISGINEYSQYAIQDNIEWLTVEPGYLFLKPPEDRSQKLLSDKDEGEDELNILGEVNALADAIAANDMEPPLVLGILGGWGSGKSYVMNLLRDRLLAIRKENILEKPVRDNFPYAGHFYLVRFDAWTYAKSDLWASLMQEVLLALNDQIAFEQLCVEKDTQNQEDLKWMEAMELALGDKEKFDQESLEALTDKLPQDHKLKQQKRPSPSRLTKEYLNIKQNQFHRRFRKILTGSDDFEPKVVERLLRDDTDVSSLLENLDNDILWSRLQGLNLRLQAELENEEKNLAKARMELSENKVNLEEKVNIKLQKEHWGLYIKTLTGTLALRIKTAIEEELNKSDSGSEVPINQAIESLGFFKKVIAGISIRSIVSFILFAGITFAVTSAINLLSTEWNSITSLIGASLLGVLESWNRVNRWLKAQFAGFQVFDKQLKDAQKERRETLISNELSSSDYQLKAQKVADLESRVKTFRQKVGLTAGHRTLLDFITSRLQEGGYEERLGPLHQIQNDMKQLSEGLNRPELCVKDYEIGRWVNLEQVLFPRGTPRVVLFIDDLDRCPPLRVVEVLEAAQLLVKTNLFVVVISMDIRYVTKALEKAYEGVLDRQGAPSGLDYIEKIVQIPYRIRPISKEAMPGYLNSQMQIEMEEPAPTYSGEGLSSSEIHSLISAPGAGTGRTDVTIPQKILTFDKEELELIQNAALAITISPRSTKRLVNVMKLIKIIWYRTGEDDIVLDIKTTVIFFLTISARLSEIMRRVLFEMEAIIRNPNHQDFRRPLLELLQRITRTWSSKEGQSTDWQFLDQICKNNDLLPSTITLEKLGIRNVELIRSFSFVGEVHIPPNPSSHQVSMQLEEPLKISQADSPEKP